MATAPPAAAGPLHRPRWTQALDLRLVRAIRRAHGGAEAWHAADGRRISWRAVMRLLEAEEEDDEWPEGLGQAQIKQRWEDGFRGWAREEEGGRRAASQDGGDAGRGRRRAFTVVFAELERLIREREYDGRRGPAARREEVAKEHGESDEGDEEPVDDHLDNAEHPLDVPCALAGEARLYADALRRYPRQARLCTHSGIIFEEAGSLVRQLCVGMGIEDFGRLARACLPSSWSARVGTEEAVPEDILAHHTFIVPMAPYDTPWSLLAVIVPPSTSMLPPYLLVCTAAEPALALRRIPPRLLQLRHRVLQLPERGSVFRLPLEALSLLVKIAEQSPDWAAMLDVSFAQEAASARSTSLLTALLSQPEVHLKLAERRPAQQEQDEVQLFRSLPMAIAEFVPMEPWFVTAQFDTKHVVDAIRKHSGWALFVVSTFRHGRGHSKQVQEHWSGEERKCVLVLELMGDEDNAEGDRVCTLMTLVQQQEAAWSITVRYPVSQLQINGRPIVGGSGARVECGFQVSVPHPLGSIRFVVKGKTYILTVGSGDDVTEPAAASDQLPAVPVVAAALDVVLKQHALTREPLGDNLLQLLSAGDRDMQQRIWGCAREDKFSAFSLLTPRQRDALLSLSSPPNLEAAAAAGDDVNHDAFEVFWDLVYIWAAPAIGKDIAVLYHDRVDNGCVVFSAQRREPAVCSLADMQRLLQEEEERAGLALLHIRARPQHAAQVARIKGAVAVQAGSKRSAAAPAATTATPQEEDAPASANGKRPRGAPALDLLAEGEQLVLWCKALRSHDDCQRFSLSQETISTLDTLNQERAVRLPSEIVRHCCTDRAACPFADSEQQRQAFYILSVLPGDARVCNVCGESASWERPLHRCFNPDHQGEWFHLDCVSKEYHQQQAPYFVELFCKSCLKEQQSGGKRSKASSTAAFARRHFWEQCKVFGELSRAGLHLREITPDVMSPIVALHMLSKRLTQPTSTNQTLAWFKEVALPLLLEHFGGGDDDQDIVKQLRALESASSLAVSYKKIGAISGLLRETLPHLLQQRVRLPHLFYRYAADEHTGKGTWFNSKNSSTKAPGDLRRACCVLDRVTTSRYDVLEAV